MNNFDDFILLLRHLILGSQLVIHADGNQLIISSRISIFSVKIGEPVSHVASSTLDKYHRRQAFLAHVLERSRKIHGGHILLLNNFQFVSLGILFLLLDFESVLGVIHLLLCLQKGLIG